jgi:ATP-dependent 26S proteasome regulatory subunit
VSKPETGAIGDGFGRDLAVYIRAGYPIINIISSEEDRALEVIEEIRKDHTLWKQPRTLFIWTISRGFVDINGEPATKDKTILPEQALMFMAKYDQAAIFLFKDFHPYLKDGQHKNASLIVRMVRDLVGSQKNQSKTMIWVSPMLQIPQELEKEVTVLDLPLPGENEYRRILTGYIDQYKDNPRVMIDLDEEGIDGMVKACQGLTLCEAENALAKAIVSRGRLDSQDIKTILAEKEQIIRKSGILEYTATVDNFGTVGGLGNLKLWLKQRNRAFSQKARDFGLPHPRGVMLVGVPGCGKSLCAKAVAAEWQKPLLKFDLGRVFGSLVGESEERMRKALKTAEEVAPAILWIDELEKGLSGAGGSVGDGGVGARVFGNLLTWMEEKTKPVFVVATANDITSLPPELLRKGRMDEIFFVDLPTPQERAEILMIHLFRRRRDHAQFDIARVVHATEGFNGAELEEIVISAMYEAFSETGKEMTTDHLSKAASEIVPLSQSRHHDIEALRQWAKANCRPAAEQPGKTGEKSDSLTERRTRLLDL